VENHDKIRALSLAHINVAGGPLGGHCMAEGHGRAAAVEAPAVCTWLQTRTVPPRLAFRRASLICLAPLPASPPHPPAVLAELSDIVDLPDRAAAVEDLMEDDGQLVGVGGGGCGWG
jgi:hypothetical protein